MCLILLTHNLNSNKCEIPSIADLVSLVVSSPPVPLSLFCDLMEHPVLLFYFYYISRYKHIHSKFHSVLKLVTYQRSSPFLNIYLHRTQCLSSSTHFSLPHGQTEEVLYAVVVLLYLKCTNKTENRNSSPEILSAKIVQYP